MPDGQRFEADEPKLLVILVADKNDLVAAPISLQTEMATEFDLIVQNTDGPLGFGFMVEVWNETPITIKHLRHYLGALDDEYTELLIELHAAYLCNESVPENVLPYVGIRIRQEDDFRLEFQANEINAVEYLSRAATAFLNNTLIEQEAQSVKRVLNLGHPIWELLNNVLGQNPAVALAAGGQTIEAEKGWFVVYGEGDSKLILELLVRRKRQVYAHVHHVGKNLERKVGVIILRLENSTISSEPTELTENTNIELGMYPDFQFDNVTQEIELELLDDNQ
ncbi:MAG: hypothetical protein K8F91_20575 [Candidatus Obscuribacterales bacterium]|nr:hypothetical protein [Candidatus Obscuribacterales bacterium]